MKCRNCNNEVSEKDKNCPYCNTPLNNNDTDNGPTLGRGMVAFIILGTIFLVAFGFYYYGQHKNDPEYTQTAIEPDSNLADNNKAKFDTVVKDTTANDSTQKQEEEQAEKVFNSIRRVIVQVAGAVATRLLQAVLTIRIAPPSLLLMSHNLLLHRFPNHVLNLLRLINEDYSDEISTAQEL